MLAASYFSVSRSDLRNLTIGIVAIVFLRRLYLSVYNVFFHPLANYPGPWVYAASDIPSVILKLSGTVPQTYLTLHEKYGTVVRVGVNELSYIAPKAWDDIYGQRSGRGQMEQAGVMASSEPFGAKSMLAASSEDHRRHRRLVSHAFSDKALREQEHLIRKYVDLLMCRLKEQAEAPGPVDMVRWFSYLTFDIISDLTYGESFHCLAESRYHPWVTMTFETLKAHTFRNVAKSFGFSRLISLFTPKAVKETGKAYVNFAIASTKRRLQTETQRPDFITYILRHQDRDTAMSTSEIQANSYLFILGGSETTSTAMCGVTYYLSRHPAILAKLVHEIRMAFPLESDIDFHAVSQLPYFRAVLNESLRMYPPSPVNRTRKVPVGGARIDGRFVPEDTIVGVAQFAAYRSSRNFKEADLFMPERWMGDPKFSSDQRDVLQPFSVGPRNCIGKNLALMEMRLVLARLLHGFELGECLDVEWSKQKAYMVWEKPPLPVNLSLRS
ncbi:isotrichodermin C-15 hydroxylase [Microthyrium microscopicum]|uniref:Isotrichodermin C-15 hydroxylase n=1 Tax=Microthyrium microscopicum TaxID=703497 RepID=A0A6A6U2A8_9PEZI|nr:isotrichodermin C-15 hydroxylase [Microthyrium microscopicum]